MHTMCQKGLRDCERQTLQDFSLQALESLHTRRPTVDVADKQVQCVLTMVSLCM